MEDDFLCEDFLTDALEVYATSPICFGPSRDIFLSLHEGSICNGVDTVSSTLYNSFNNFIIDGGKYSLKIVIVIENIFCIVSKSQGSLPCEHGRSYFDHQSIVSIILSGFFNRGFNKFLVLNHS